MAKIIEQTLVITVSKMVPNSAENPALPLTAENLAEVASVVEALSGDGTLVEITQACPQLPFLTPLSTVYLPATMTAAVKTGQVILSQPLTTIADVAVYKPLLFL
jgi:hypothetical protein